VEELEMNSLSMKKQGPNFTECIAIEPLGKDFEDLIVKKIGDKLYSIVRREHPSEKIVVFSTMPEELMLE
jgi:hypothetical protein